MTKIKKANIKFYPVIIYLLAKMVNKHEEFCTAFNENGHLGVYDLLHPSYAYFQNGTETFTNSPNV